MTTSAPAEHGSAVQCTISCVQGRDSEILVHQWSAGWLPHERRSPTVGVPRAPCTLLGLCCSHARKLLRGRHMLFCRWTAMESS